MITKAQFFDMQQRLQPKHRQPIPEDGCDSEGKLHREIIDYCNSQWPPLPFIHARMDQRSTIGAGCPDFAIMLPGGKVLLVECKRRTGKVSMDQAAWHLLAQGVGHTVHVVRSMEDFLKLV